MFTALVIAGFVSAVLGAAYITNPFNKWTLIRRPFVAEMLQGTLKAINNNQKLTIRQNVWWRWFAIVKCGIHIVTSRYVSSPRSSHSTLSRIIADIHTLRFNPKKLLLTSGDHFSALFVRNLGVFYYPMLDGCIETSERDWHNRQIVYLQTVAYALGVFAKRPIPTTTIVPTGPYGATCVNFYAYPSDTVYGILYALSALLGKQSASPASYSKPIHQLDSGPAAKIMLNQYKPTIRDLYHHYRTTVFDQQTGLVTAAKHFSGAKDITKRSSSFYDNAIFWKTTQLAMRLGIIETKVQFLADLKNRILKTFWLNEQGYFLEDLSPEAKQHAYYSSDWLIVLCTGFLDVSKKSERAYFEQSVNYIQKSGVDKPFALKYHNDVRAHRQFFAVRFAVASYGGDSIWSFWGMEYIKTLLLLYKKTNNKKYLKDADYHIESYKRAMIRDRGFPEVYDSQGHLLQTLLYRSIRQTGWVIGFEQVLAIRKTL